MRKSNAFTLAAVVCGFSAYLSNVVLGASGGPAFLSDVGEMLMLFASCIFFVIFVLQRERAAESGGQVEK